MGTFASELKSEREKRKVSLAHIAAETRISLRHLESLEEGRFEDLPGGIYDRAFLKAYCETLNLPNTLEIIRRYDAERVPASEKPLKSRVHIPQPSPSFKISPLVVWGLMLIISVTGLFFSRKWITAVFSPYFSHTPASAVRYESVPPKPAPKTQETAIAETPAPPVAAATTAAIGPETQTAAAPDPPVPSEPAPSQQPPSQQITQPNAAFPPAAPSLAPQSLRLEISATDKCWVSVDRDGSPAFRKTMEPGEMQVITAAERFRIILGNAGGVHLRINGKQAKPLGKSGQVVKFLIDGKNLPDILEQTAG